MRKPKIIFVTSLLLITIVFFSRCYRNEAVNGNDPRGKLYAGSKTCMTCHKDIANSYVHNNHYKTSSAINNDSLKARMAAFHNFYFPDSSSIGMEEKNGSYYQSSFVNGKETRAAPFDIAFGSAEKAQTYGYWQGDKLYQLPLTYFTSMNVWANSPGFPVKRAYFDRIIEGRCLECHSTYINKEFVQSGSLDVQEKFDRNSVIYGIDCERCHGPAAAHVEFHTERPSVKTPMYITSIKSLTRQQKLDVCATCHSGNDQASLRSLFAFMPGDTLSDFYFPDFDSGKKEPDVHGKQMQLLQASQCFIQSGMTCNSCHDAHEASDTKMPVFVSKCMNCHQQSAHAVTMLKQNDGSQAAGLVSKNCIDCHMPLLQSKTIFFNSGAALKQIPYFLRTHRIAVYDQDTDKGTKF